MLKNKNRLIIPGRTIASKDEDIVDDYFSKVYINALKYYADDKSPNKEDLLFSAIFLYSLGDKQLFENKEEDFLNKNREVKEEAEFFSTNLISSIQLRMKNRKYILDSNVYNMKELINFFRLDIHTSQRENHELFSLIIENLKERYIYKGDESLSFEEHLKNHNTDHLKNSMKNVAFSGLLDNNDFDDKFNKIEKAHFNFQLDSYLKSELQTWKIKHEKKSSIEKLSSDIYPYVDTILFSNSEYFIVLVATPSDENYIDNKTDPIDKVFDCTLNIYKNENQKMNPLSIVPFKDKLTYYIGGYINDCALDLLQENMNGSIGEAADISRYWYSNGYEKLFDLDYKKEWDKKNIFHNPNNSIDFYTMFVETLLCEINTENLKIKNTEIYPFDRVFIIPDSGLDDSFRGVDSIQVLEAKMKSKDPFDRNGYIVGWEQDVERDGKALIDEVDLVFSDKKINKIKWHLSEFGSSEFKFQHDAIEKPLKSHLNSNLLLSSVLLSSSAIEAMNFTDNEVKKKIYDGQKRTIRESFDNFGLHYSYEFGLDLQDAYPSLYKMQQKYFMSMRETEKEKDKNRYTPLKKDDRTGFEYIPSDYPKTYRGVEEDILLDNIMKQFRERKFKSKVVTICFDPERIIGINKEIQKYLGISSRITMVFVADKDPLKTTSELKAEEEDLKVLMQMVIRQIVYNAKLEQAIEEERKQLQTLLPQALHTAKGFITTDKGKEDLDNLLIEYRAKFSKTLKTSEDKYKEYRGSSNFETILKDLIKDSQKDIYQLVEDYKNTKIVENQNNNFDFKLHINNSILPDMKIIWDPITVPEAFHVLLKNSVQHAVMYGQDNSTSQVFISMNIEKQYQSEFLAISIVNSTTQISEDRFNMLNDIESEGMDANDDKNGSTGIGVALARKQLQIVNEHNGISFEMLSKNMISVKILLKINNLKQNDLFAKKEVVSSKTPKKSTANDIEVIYLEDTKEYYEKTLKYLKTKRIEVFHSESLDITHMKDAKLLLTDMSILNAQGKADELEGLAAIEEFREINSNNAPICILSNASAVDIQAKVMEHLDLDNVESVVVIRDNTLKLKEGIIYILDNKKIITSDNSVIDNYLTSIESIKNKEPLEVAQTSNLVNFLDDTGSYSDDFLQCFENSSNKNFLAASTSAKKLSLMDILDKWLNFKIPRLGTQGRKYTVSNVTYHKNILLIIDDIKISHESEKWWLNYLGITHNIIFNFNALSHASILQNWQLLAMKRESSGYLSKLRHDIKNYRTLYEVPLKNTTLIATFDSIMETTLKLQRVLKVARYESVKVYIESTKFTLEDEKKIFNKAEELSNNIATIKKDLLLSIEILKESGADQANIDNLELFKNLTELYITYSSDSKGVSS